MEFGLSESLLIYSGGLGMLAGDHLKTASDLGVPMAGIGLLYQQGYFRQVIAEDGKQLVRQMTQFLSQPERSGRAMFLEDYDMVLGQHLVAGVDVRLNTPLRPNEACGTSGMKVLANGGLNVSVLDGWWDEAVDVEEPENESIRPGWIVGSREPGTVEELGRRDAESLFDLLEKLIIPEHYERALNRWSHVRIGQVRFSEHDMHREVSVELWLDELPPESVRVELFAESDNDSDPETIALEQSGRLPGSVNGFVYTAPFESRRPKCDYTVRVMPWHPAAFLPVENQCITGEH